MQEDEKPRRLNERTVDFRRPSAEVSQQPAASGQRPVSEDGYVLLHWLLVCCLLVAEALRAKRAEPADFIHKLNLAQKELKESRVWLLFASRMSPGPTVGGLRAESRELLLMIGESISTAVSRSQGKTIGA